MQPGGLPDRDQLASGGANPADCQIFNLSPSRDGNIAFSPGQTLVVRQKLRQEKEWGREFVIVAFTAVDSQMSL